MILKYNLATEIIDEGISEVRWINPLTIADLNLSNYQFNKVLISKGTPFTIEVPNNYRVRYIAFNSVDQFTLTYNTDTTGYLTKSVACDYGPERTGFSTLRTIDTIIVTNPTGTSGLPGNQFTNPANIEVKYLIVFERILVP